MTRKHTVNQSSGASLVKANVSPTVQSKTRIEVRGNYHYIISNGMPDHKVGQFPNSGNPNPLSSQSYTFNVPLNQKDLQE